LVGFITRVVHSAFLYASIHKYQYREDLNSRGVLLASWGFNININENVVFEGYVYSNVNGFGNGLATAPLLHILYII
jgi:hypothetical protein